MRCFSFFFSFSSSCSCLLLLWYMFYAEWNRKTLFLFLFSFLPFLFYLLESKLKKSEKVVQKTRTHHNWIGIGSLFAKINQLFQFILKVLLAWKLMETFIVFWVDFCLHWLTVLHGNKYCKYLHGYTLSNYTLSCSSRLYTSFFLYHSDFLTSS